MSRIDCFVFGGRTEHLLETRKVVSQILEDDRALDGDGVAREQRTVTGKDERDRTGGVSRDIAEPGATPVTGI